MSGSSHEFQLTVSAERSNGEFDGQEYENQQRIDCIRPKHRSISEPVQTSEDENQQGIENVRPRLRSYSKDVQPSEYVNQQTIEDIQPRMRSISGLDRAIEYENHKVDFIQSRLSPIPELKQANADEYEQGIEYVQPRHRSISTDMQPDEYENQQGMDNIQSRLSSISGLEQVNEYENQQGIDYIRSRLSSISEYDDQEVIEYAPKLRSSAVSETEQAKEYKKKEIEYIQTKSRSTEVTDAHQQEKQGNDISSEHADQDELHQEIIYVPTIESLPEEKTDQEIQQEKYDESWEYFRNLKFSFRAPESDEQLHS